MVIHTTIDSTLNKTSIRNGSTPSKGDKDQMTLKNSTYRQPKTVHEKNVDNYSSTIKDVTIK